MKRYRIIMASAVLLLLILLTSACDRKRETEIDPREMQMKNLQARITEMDNSVNGMQAQLNQAKTTQSQLAEHIIGIQNSLSELQNRMAETRTTLNTLSQVEQAQKARETRGWPWAVRILLILALLVVLYLIWRKVVRGSDTDDESADEGFVEETELGSVRYPGAKSESSRKKE